MTDHRVAVHLVAYTSAATTALRVRADRAGVWMVESRDGDMVVVSLLLDRPDTDWSAADEVLAGVVGRGLDGQVGLVRIYGGRVGPGVPLADVAGALRPAPAIRDQLTGSRPTIWDLDGPASTPHLRRLLVLVPADEALEPLVWVHDTLPAPLARTAVAAIPQPGAEIPTVGIIAAEAEEFVAIRALLTGSRHYQQAHDRASYVVGALPSTLRESPHPVVVTLLADEGGAPAADATANLTRSFAGIRCVVVLGTTTHAAGARPGDVLVSDHERGTAGAMSIRPSPLLTRAARLLDANALLGERPWQDAMGTALVALPPRFAHPDRPDVRYDPMARAGWPAVEQEGVAVGRSSLAGGREWFVVRGVAPDERWRAPAALAAAAYVVALLGTVRPMLARGPEFLDEGLSAP